MDVAPLVKAGSWKYGFPPEGCMLDEKTAQWFTIRVGCYTCNLNCPYCYNRPFFTRSNRLDFRLSDVERITPKVYNISLTIGEPGMSNESDLLSVISLMSKGYEVFVKTNGLFVEKYSNEKWFELLNVNIDWKPGFVNYIPSMDFSCSYKELTWAVQFGFNDGDEEIDQFVKFVDTYEFDKYGIVAIREVYDINGKVIYNPGYTFRSFYYYQQTYELLQKLYERGLKPYSNIPPFVFEKLKLGDVWYD